MEAEADVHSLKSGERACDQTAAAAAATVRASPRATAWASSTWFCQPHAAEYNRSWNFFAGMSEGEIRARMADDLATGGRPTWPFRSGARNRGEAAANSRFLPRSVRHLQRRPVQGRGRARRLRQAPRHGLERGALADLNLDATANAAAIRARYTELVKRCHPDANGGDRSAEHKLQRVIKAYKTLTKARLV